MDSEKRLSTKSPLDKLLNGGIEHRAVTNVYGEAGTGKSNVALLCCMSAVEKGKKAVFIDTEGGFSFERLNQLASGNGSRYLSQIILLEPKSWKEQCQRVEELDRLVKAENVGLIVIDSIVSLYRAELSDENFHDINRQLTRQYALLSLLAREHDIPVLVTNQVYSIDGKIELTSKTISRYWSKALVKLEKLETPGHRAATVIKHRSLPEGSAIEFVISGNSLKEAGKFGLF